MYRYLAVKELCQSDEIGGYETFGILAFERCGKCWIEAGRVSDVSISVKEVNVLAQLYTTEQLEPVHLQEMVLDFLNRSAVL